jgi:two-component system sensor histidine kinase RegB
MLGGLMAADVGLFTLLLLLTGGAFNPFNFLYLVYIALAAVVLPAVWTWALAAFSLACFGALFWVPPPGSDPSLGAHDGHLHAHLQGMWFAFAVAAAFIVYFVQRVTRALAERERELAEARTRSARSERLASLGTLAAGAAHQLATPLSTIAVIAGELEDQLRRIASSEDAIEDARTIREQVERCRDILTQMAADAGESSGEPLIEVAIEALLASAVHGLDGEERAEIRIDAGARGRAVLTPRRSVAQAIRAVIKNGIEASERGTPVAVRVGEDREFLRIEVSDRGGGMPAEVLEHVGEPFFTTKGPDRGMGLGLFLTRTVVESLGGRFRIDSTPGVGTSVVLMLPRAPATIGRIAADGTAAAS